MVDVVESSLSAEIFPWGGPKLCYGEIYFMTHRLHEKLRMIESRRGASFAGLFGTALYLGAISRRRVQYEVWPSLPHWP